MKTTRLNFLKSGLGLASIIAASQSPAILVKSMLANRSNITSEYDENNFPYVSNGLVAMWDGEYPNGIYGEIIENTSEWVDIINGSIYGKGTNIIYDPVNKCFDTNKIGKSNAARFNFNTVYASEGMSIEIVFEATYASATYRAFALPQGWAGIKIGVSHATIAPLGSANVVSNIPLFTPTYSAFVCTNAQMNNKVYYNGNIGAIGNTPNNLFINYIDIPAQSAGHVSGKVYAIRVYSRELSEKEIAYNYTIDAERFGL